MLSGTIAVGVSNGIDPELAKVIKRQQKLLLARKELRR